MITKLINNTIRAEFLNTQIFKHIWVDKNQNHYHTPYISTYYYNPKPYTDEDVVIPYYVTDYNQSEYLYDSYKNFSIVCEIDGETTIKRSVTSGDNQITIGKLSPGIHQFSLQAFHNGEPSHKLYNEVYVVDRNTYDITEEQTYIISDDDLARHNINKSGSLDATDMTNTREGLSNLFAEIKNNGYRKCVLVNGFYMVNEDRDQDDGFGAYNEPIDIPTEFTIDLNGSTIKLYNDTVRNKGFIIRMNDCMDSHLINGTIEGSYISGSNPGQTREHLYAIQVIGSKYCSFENLTIKNNNGYAVMTSTSGNVKHYTINSTWSANTSVENGELISFDGKATSALTDLLDLEMLSINRFLGYQGFEGNSIYVDIHFYDEQEQYIETIRAIQYRKIKKPNNAKYIRATIDSDNDTFSLQITDFNTPTNCAFKNIQYKDTWTCAMAPAQFNNLLIENCTFDNCGHCGINDITPIAIDFEDGWEMGQDCYIRNCEIIKQAGTLDLVTCRGSNYVIEGCNNWRVAFRGGTLAPVFRNNKKCSVDYRVSPFRTRSSYGRICDNKEMKSMIIQRDTDYTGTLLPLKAAVRDNELTGGMITSTENLEAINCVMDLSSLSDFSTSTYIVDSGTYRKCTIKNLNANNACAGSIEMYDCTLENINNCYFSRNLTLQKCTVNNCYIKAHGYDGLYSFDDTIFTNCYFEIPTWVTAKRDVMINNCSINNDSTRNVFLLVGAMYDNKISITNSNIDITNILLKLNSKTGSVCTIDILNNTLNVGTLINGDTTIGSIVINESDNRTE